MLRLLIAATLIAATPAMASTWPDEDWAYDAERIATADEVSAFQSAEKCNANVDGEEVRIIRGAGLMVFKVAKDGSVYRVFNATAERYMLDLCVL